MKIVVAGMDKQKAAALAVLVAKIQPGWHSECVDGLADLGLVNGALGLLDLPGLGLHRHTEAHAQTVLHALAGNPAVLLTTLHDQTWATWLANAPAVDQLYLLRTPFKAVDMRQALERQAAFQPSHRAPAPLPSPTAKAKKSDDGQLSLDEFVAALGQRDANVSSLFLQTLAQALKSGQSFEIRLTPQHCIVACAELHWIATNTPASVIQRLVQSDGLASVAQVRPIDSAAALHLARLLNMAFQPTDIFLWELLYPPTTNSATE
jgi:hypothetical protein